MDKRCRDDIGPYEDKRRMVRLIATLLLIAPLAACTGTVPRKKLPFPLTNDTFDEQVKVVTVPLPIIASSPNEGITYGGLSAFLLHNKRDEVSTLIAPQVNYNENFGATATVHGSFYPSPERNWRINLSKSARINEEYKIRHHDGEFLSDKLELNAAAFVFRDGSARFFGFQSSASKANETNYSDRELGGEVSAGYRVFRHLQLVFGERVKRVAIERGAIKGLPFINDRFSPATVPGSDGFIVHAQKLSAVYSTLDSAAMPTSGGEGRVAVENSARAFGSSAAYQGYEAELKGYLPLEEARYVSVFRVAFNQVNGSNVPFLEKAILGGETTLRGYGRNRFIDNSYLLLNLEERIRLFRLRLFNVLADWEVAPFIDLGSVMPSIDRANPNSFEFNPGIGLRAVIRPNLVCRVDTGFGRDGPAVFVGLGYPF